MGYIIKDDVEYGGINKTSANGTSYNNEVSGLDSTNVQGALDELKQIIEQMKHNAEYHPGDEFVYARNNNGAIGRTGPVIASSAYSNAQFDIPLDKPIGSDVTSVTVEVLATSAFGLVSNTSFSDFAVDQIATVFRNGTSVVNVLLHSNSLPSTNNTKLVVYVALKIKFN